MLFEDLTADWVRHLSIRAAANSRAMVEQIKDDARQYRPPGLCVDGAMRRDYYEGRHATHFLAFLSATYPRAMVKDEIHPVTVNYVRTWAEADADIYRAGEPIRRGETDAETERLKLLSKAAELSVILPDTEVKAHAARQMFLKVLRNPKNDKLDVTQHWPHTVWVVPDPAAPTDLNEAPVIMVQLGAELYEIWSSTEVLTQNMDGSLDVQKAWIAVQVHTNKKNPRMVEVLTEPYQGSLPICCMYVSPPEAGPYLTDDADLIPLANNHMLGWTDIFHLVRMQGHSPVYVSSMMDTLVVEGGPGGITQLGPDDTMGALQTTPQIKDARDLLNDFTGAIARSRTQSPRAYSTAPTALNSGLALRVDNRLTEEKRPQRIALMEKFEREYLLPILDEMDRLMPPRHKAPLKNQTVIGEIAVSFPPQRVVEDLAQRQNRLQHAQEIGWISKAQAAVDAGFYTTVEEAEIAIAKLPPPQPAQGKADIAQHPPRGPASDNFQSKNK